MSKSWNYLRVKKLKELLNNVPDETVFLFGKKKDNDREEELILNNIYLAYNTIDGYNVPNIYFVLE